MKRPIKIACVGDSITEGSYHPDPSVDSYPSQLQRLLGEGYQVGNFGVGGATLLAKGTKPYRSQQAFESALLFQPAVVLIKLGTNDTKPENWIFKDEFVHDYKAMIYLFQQIPSNPRIVLLTPASIFRGESDRRNAVLQQELIPLIEEVAMNNACEWLDLWTPTKGLQNHFPDGVHPDTEGTALLANLIYHYLVP